MMEDDSVPESESSQRYVQRLPCHSLLKYFTTLGCQWMELVHGASNAKCDQFGAGAGGQSQSQSQRCVGLGSLTHCTITRLPDSLQPFRSKAVENFSVCSYCLVVVPKAIQACRDQMEFQ